MNRLPGVYRAIVTGVGDPEHRGGVEIRIPAAAGETTAWARIVTQRQDAYIPSIGEEVVVAFEEGDIARPIVLGRLWAGKSRPPV
jgi:uncharacterized protein involved in type VI secretion and phage assembly